MRWLVYFFILFVAVDAVVIAYWRDSQVNISLGSILFYLLAVPLLVGGASYLIIFIYKKIKDNNDKNIDDQELPAKEDSSSSDESLQKSVYLTIHATALQTSEGEYSDEILESLKQYKTAQLDPELINASGVSLLSRRIDMSKDEIELIEESMNPEEIDTVEWTRFKRMAIILQRLLQALQPQLFLLAEGMSEAAAWRIRPGAEQLILHPAWSGQQEEQLTEHTEQVIDKMQQWPAHLQIHCFLPSSWDQQDHEYIQNIIKKFLQQLSFNPAQFSITPIIMEDEPNWNQTQLFADLLQKISNDEKNIYLIMGVDSLIDQNEVEQIIWDNSDYISAEAGYALLLSNQSIDISEFDEKSYVFIDSDIKNTNFDSRDKANLILSSINPRIHMNSLKGLLSYLNNFTVDIDSIVFTGGLLENVSHQSTGLSFTFSAALAQQLDDKIYLFSPHLSIENFYWLFSKNPSKDTDSGDE